MSAHRRWTVPLATVALAATLVLPAAWSANAAAPASTTDRVQAAAGWLATQFANGSHLPAPNGDHFDAKFGKSYFPNYGQNADAIFGLAAAKAGGTKSAAALRYLAKTINDYADLSASQGGPFDGSIAKSALAAIVAGSASEPATDFGGHNLLQALKTDECAATATTCTPGAPLNIFASVSESLVILAEARGGGSYAPSTAAISYFLSLQCADGGFTNGITACGSGAPDVDSTSYAIMALAAAGGQPSALAKAVTWLTDQRHSAGYWVSQGVPNVNSTGLAAAALAAQGASVTASRSWLLSQQVAAGKPGAGALKYAGRFQPTTTSATSTAALATAQGLLGLTANASLATLTAAGSASGTTLFAPTDSVSASSLAVGAKHTVTGHGFAAGERVDATIRATALGHAVADPSGTVRLSFTLPAGVAAGPDAMVLTGHSSGLAASHSVTVTAAAPTVIAGPASTAPATAPATAAPANSDALADTGLDGPLLVQLSALALAMVLLGGALTAWGRRRPVGKHLR